MAVDKRIKRHKVHKMMGMYDKGRKRRSVVLWSRAKRKPKGWEYRVQCVR